MRHLSLGVALALLVAAGPADAAPKGGKGAQVSLDSDKLPPGTYAGVLLNVPADDGTFSLRVQVQQPVLNTGGKGGANPQKQLQQIIRQIQEAQRRAMTGRRPGNAGRRPGNAGRRPGNRGKAGNRGRVNPAEQLRRLARERQKALQRLAGKGGKGGAGGAGIKMQTITYTIAFQAAPDLVVRSLNPPEAFDDKGNIKKYTTSELRALKGANPRLPGYEASKDDLAPGNIVQVSLSTRPRGKGAAAEEVKRTQVRMIVRVAEGEPIVTKKKKK